MNIVVLVGNPKPRSRTFEAAHLVARSLAGEPTTAIDVADLGAGLLGWGDPTVGEALAVVQHADVLVVASPTYKASYTGLLKLFLDQIPSDGLDGVVAVPLMLGAGPGHQLAAEVFLKPVLVELGATCPTRGVYLLDSSYTTLEATGPWLDRAKRQVANAVAAASS